MLQIFLRGLDLLIIRRLIFLLRLIQSIHLLMVYLYQILSYAVLLLGVWCISLLLVQILYMMFMLLVSLLLLLLQFIGQLFFVFCSIFGVQSCRVFYFHQHLPWSCVHTLMLIMIVIPQIVSLLLASLFFWVILLFLGRARSNILFLIFNRSRISCYGIHYQRDCLVTLVTCRYESFSFTSHSYVLS